VGVGVACHAFLLQAEVRLRLRERRILENVLRLDMISRMTLNALDTSVLPLQGKTDSCVVERPRIKSHQLKIFPVVLLMAFNTLVFDQMRMIPRLVRHPRTDFGVT
jgi:hypothetical protein